MMTVGKFVEKQQLIDQLQQAVLAQETVFFSVLTDMKRSILLRFSIGKLIHSYCRSRDVTQAIEAINECQQLKFTRSNGQPKAVPEVIQADMFLKSISSDSVNVEPVVGFAGADALVVTDGPVVTAELREKLIEIARDYIGLVADMLVGDICDQQHSPEVTVDKIAGVIPVKAQSDVFRERALIVINE